MHSKSRQACDPVAEQLTFEGVHEVPWPDPQVIKTRSGWTTELHFNLVQNEDQLARMYEALATTQDIVYDSETSGLNPHLGARIVGHALAAATSQYRVDAWYVPIRHIGGHNETQPQIAPTRAAEIVRPILANPHGRCGLHHAKFDIAMLRADGIDMLRAVEDTSIDATIDNENEPSFALKFLAAKYCVEGARTEEKDLDAWMRADARRLKMPFRKSKRGSDSLDALDEPSYLERFGYARSPITLCGQYACKDVFYTLYLWLLRYKRTAEQHPELWRREHRISQILHKMEWIGLAADGEVIRQAHDLSAHEVRHWLAEARRLSGDPAFEGTDAELRHLFYKKLRMPVLRYTKGGSNRDTRDANKKPSVDRTARKLLEKRCPEHKPLIHATLKLARARKLHSTYSGSFLKFLSDEGRIHPSYNQLEQREEGGVPVTGRLSSAAPNIQNIDSKPLHLSDCGCSTCVEEEGHPPGDLSTIEVRRYFVVPEGRIRFYIDFSQIELRVLAWFCQDPTMLRAYREDIDLHQLIADELSIDRKIAKQVNFGNSYGMTKVGLAQRLPGYYTDPDGTEAIAERVLKAYFQRYANILHFRAQLADHMRRNNCQFTNPFGRVRRIPTIRSQRGWERERAERMMMSSIISGTSADIMKEALIRCDDLCAEHPHYAEPVQTVHDELVFDVDHKPGWASLLVRLVQAMEDWPQFSEPNDGRHGVPIKVNAEVTTTSWKDKRGVVVTPDGALSWAA